MLLSSILLTVSYAAFADCGVAGARSVLSFDVLQAPPDAVMLPNGLVLGVRQEFGLGYDLFAAEDASEGSENLLDHRVHGPDPSDLYGWSHLQKYYPDVRRILVSRHRGEVIVDLRDVRSAPDSAGDAAATGSVLAGPSGKFVDGTVHVCWLSVKANA